MKVKKLNIQYILQQSLYILLGVNLFLLTQFLVYTYKSHTIEKKLENTILFFKPLTIKDYKKSLEEMGIEYSFIKKVSSGPTKLAIFENDTFVGYLYDMKKDVACPVCSDLRFLLFVNKYNQVIDIEFTSPLESYGQNIPDEEIDRFIQQFKGKKINDISTSDIDIITGATKSCFEFAKSINDFISP